MRRTPIKTIVVSVVAAFAAAMVATPASAAPGDPITVSGYVTDSNGQPTFGEMVYVTGPATFVGYAFTDENGYYSVTGTSAAEVEYLSVYAGQAVCDPIEPFSAPASLSVNCTAPATWSITLSGTASSTNGLPVEGMWLQFRSGFSGGSAVIGENGYFETTMEVPADSPGIDIYSPSDFGSPIATVTGLFDGAVFSGIDVAFYVPVPPAMIDIEVAGTVTKRNGKPLAGVAVVVQNDSGTMYETTTASDGTYSVTYEGLWDQEWNWVTPAFVSINGEWVEYLGTASATEPNIVDYRQGKTAVFEPFALGLELSSGGFITDIYRKAGPTGVADWRVCTETACYGAEFGSKKTELFDITPIDGQLGEASVLVREPNGAEYDWWRINTLGWIEPATTFGPKNFDGYAYVDFFGWSVDHFIAWADKGGKTSLWTWDDALALGVTTQQVDGRFVSIDFVDLDGDLGKEVVLTTRKGDKHTVYQVNSSTEEPIAVATGKGVPTVSYEDSDSDGLLEIVVTYP